MARQMADETFRTDQERNRYAAHVRAINELVDGLRDQDGRGWMPYVAPWHGGTEARLLSVLRDPGPKTQDGTGSGFLCTENVDPTAERQCRAFEQKAGADALTRLLGLMPDLRVVLLQDGDAQATWRRLEKAHLALAGQERFQVVRTYQPGRQAPWSPDAEVRAAREQHRADALRQVADILRA
ncbi:uracil-DNA glycosylase [Streptomyces sp. bgisy095]|uniref:uracil-DNA glycosylase n=1 Tax=unclassified Streptomyces TaxID=2593676 RepID=UPI003D72F729